MPSVAAPRRSLSKGNLQAALASAKTQSYPDTTASGRTAPPSSQSSAGTLSSSINPPASSIRTLAWSPSGGLIATADARVLRVWNPDKPGVRYSTELKLPTTSTTTSTSSSAPNAKAPLSSSAQHLSGVEKVAWNPTKDSELCSAGSDGVVRFWDVRAKTAMVGECKVGDGCLSLAWKPDGEDVVVGRKDDVLVPISRHSMTALGNYPQGTQTNQIAFSNGGTELLLTTGDSTVKIVDYPSMNSLYTINAHTSSCYCIAHDPRGRYLAVGGSDALITLWETADFTCRHSLAEMSGPVRSVSFSFDGSYIVGGSEEGTGLMIAQVESGEYVHVVPTNAPSPAVQWHPSRYWLAFGGDSREGLRVLGAGGGSL